MAQKAVWPCVRSRSKKMQCAGSKEKERPYENIFIDRVGSRGREKYLALSRDAQSSNQLFSRPAPVPTEVERPIELQKCLLK